MIKVLYVNHRQQQCGVYEFGRSIGNVLTNSKKYDFKYCECDSLDELKKQFNAFGPKVIIYNYHPSTMKWISPKSRYDAPSTFKLNAIHIGTIHEVYQRVADEATDEIFDFHIASDPTLMLKNPIVFKTGRLLPQKPTQVIGNEKIPIIGSFGFATGGKGFDKIINLVQKEFDEAIIRLNIPYAKFGDETGEHAKRIAQQCRNLIYKKSVQLFIDHTYLEDKDLLTFLSSNSLNVFLYDDMPDRGISSATDWAIACGKPLAISKSRLFRHLFSCMPSICIEENNLHQIISNGIISLHQIWNDWSKETMIWDYERIVTNSIQNTSKSGFGKRNRLFYYSKKVLRKIGYLKEAQISLNQWTKSEDKFEYKVINYKNYEPIPMTDSIPLNRILDEEARVLFKPTIRFLEQNLPELMAKKIPEANVQQAFVLDTTVRLSRRFSNPKILAIGSFEDTAVEGLKMLNYDLESIDPILNYDLQTFISKPGIQEGSYDLIVSTSVIEHVKDDEQFMRDIAYLLKKGGYAILTCDFNDHYKPGDDIPPVDYRFYTQADLKERLMDEILDCSLVDRPQWDCDTPDFILADTYKYTFATLVITKN